MKIKLSNTLAFTPVQHVPGQVTPRRAVGQLHGTDDGRDYLYPVHEYRYDSDDVVRYLIDPTERVYLDQQHDLPVVAANASELKADEHPDNLIWVEHESGQSYKPYAFLVMNGMKQLVRDWDGIIYRAPSGEQLEDAAWHETLQVIDACECAGKGLWAMVQLDSASALATPDGSSSASQTTGWIRL